MDEGVQQKALLLQSCSKKVVKVGGRVGVKADYRHVAAAGGTVASGVTCSGNQALLEGLA